MCENLTHLQTCNKITISSAFFFSKIFLLPKIVKFWWSFFSLDTRIAVAYQISVPREIFSKSVCSFYDILSFSHHERVFKVFEGKIQNHKVNKQSHRKRKYEGSSLNSLRPISYFGSTPTPWLTLLLVLGKSRVKQNLC